PLVEFLAASSDTGARLAASALADLHASHATRYGSPHTVEDALRRAADPDLVIRRLSQALAGAAPAEQAAICLVLGVVGTDAAVPVLTTLLDSPETLEPAAAALKAIGQRSSELQLLKALREGDSARRR